MRRSAVERLRRCYATLNQLRQRPRSVSSAGACLLTIHPPTVQHTVTSVVERFETAPLIGATSMLILILSCDALLQRACLSYQRAYAVHDPRERCLFVSRAMLSVENH